MKENRESVFCPRKLIVSMKLSRKFTLLDLMILVAATAGGMALLKTCVAESYMRPRSNGWLWYAVIIREGIWLSWYFLTALGPALLVLRLLPPRPRLRKVLRQPGTVACYAMIPPLFLQATAFAILTAKESRRTLMERAYIANLKGYLRDPYFMGEHDAGLVVLSVVGAWLTLFLIGRWRPEPTWIDRAGRFVGFAWIAGYLVIRSWGILSRFILEPSQWWASPTAS